MSFDYSTDTGERAYPTAWDARFIDGSVLGTNNEPSDHGQCSTNYGETSQVPPNEIQPSNDPGAQNQHESHEDNFYPGAETLFNQRLTLAKPIKSPFDIRYKSNYFAYSGKGLGKPQSLRPMCTMDGDPEITIKLPEGFIRPPNPGNYFLEAMFLTPPRLNQHHVHVNKFQRNNKDFSVPDENPFLLQLTGQHCDSGEIKVQLVPIKTLQSELKVVRSLPLFTGQPDSNEQVKCNSVEHLRETYGLNRAVIAFSLGYLTPDGHFIRFPNTTVLSDELVEREESEPTYDVTCPQCSHQFTFQANKKKGQKRSASASALHENKKRSSHSGNEQNLLKGLISDK